MTPVLIFAVMALVLAFSAIKIVPQGRQYTAERFGRYTRTLKPGISFLVPFVDRIGRRLSMMETVLDVPRQDVITKDNAVVSVDAVVFIQVIDAPKAAYEVENLRLAIQNLCMTNIRTVVGAMDLDEVLSQRDAINARLLGVVDAATEAWGTKVMRIEIKDLAPPEDITQSMARQMKAERERRAQILEAEGRREAAFRDAEAREREAEAEAKATDMVSQAIAKGDVNAIRYFLGLKYVEAFGELATSNQQRTVIVPADLSGLAGLVEGLRALNAQGEGPFGGAPRTSVPPTRP